MNVNYLKPVYSSKLIGLKKYFDDFKNLYDKGIFPKVILLSGREGIGKFTMVSHLMHYFFDRKNYDIKDNSFKDSYFHKLFIENISQNVTYFSNNYFNNIKIDDIRDLKSKLLKSNLNDSSRFIIFDDIEKININSINSLLKIIEEPTIKNYFILINNKSKPLLETIRSRCIEFKIILNQKESSKVISYLTNENNQTNKFEINLFNNISPGDLLKLNYLFDLKKIDPKDDVINNLNILLSLYKKEAKELSFNLIFLYIDFYYQYLLKQQKNTKIIMEKRSNAFKKISNYLLYNLNQNTLLSSLEKELIYE